MFSSRGGSTRVGVGDARARIEIRRRAQHVQEKVAAIRRQQNQQRRSSEGNQLQTRKNIVPGDLSAKLTNRMDLSSKLMNRRNRLGGQRGQFQQQPTTKTFQNFKVVADVDDAELPASSPLGVIVKKISGIDNARDMTNFKMRVFNNKAIPAPPQQRFAIGNKRSISTTPISPMKRRRQVDDDDDEIMEEIQPKRPAGGMGMFVSALKRAQSQDYGAGSSISGIPRRTPTTAFGGTPFFASTMMADVEEIQRPMRVPIQQRLSTPARVSGTSGANMVNGFRVLIKQLNDTVTADDLKELFSSIGQLKDAYLLEHGLGEVIFVKKADAEIAVKQFHNRELDGIPMHCELLPSMTTKIGMHNPKYSSSKLNQRFQGSEGEVDMPSRGSVANTNAMGPNPDRELVTSVLFGGNRVGVNGKPVSFTVKV